MKVIWLDRAETALRHTEKYLLQEYGEIVRDRFMQEVKDVAYLF